MCASSKNSAMVDVTCKLSTEDGRASVRYSSSSEAETDGVSGSVYFTPKFNVDVPAMFEAMSKALAERGQS